MIEPFFGGEFICDTFDLLFKEKLWSKILIVYKME